MLVRDVGVAEALARDALVAALEQWPAEGALERAEALIDGKPGPYVLQAAIAACHARPAASRTPTGSA